MTGKDKTNKRASKAMLDSELVATAIAVRGEIRGRFSIAKIEGIMKLLGREFSAMVEGRHTGQPSTSSLTTENGVASHRGQQSKDLSEQVLVVIAGPGLKFKAYSSELFLVVKRMKGGNVTMEHREKVSAGDKTQAIVHSTNMMTTTNSNINMSIANCKKTASHK